MTAAMDYEERRRGLDDDVDGEGDGVPSDNGANRRRHSSSSSAQPPQQQQQATSGGASAVEADLRETKRQYAELKKAYNAMASKQQQTPQPPITTAPLRAKVV